jgi:hypothetical protein
MKRIAFAHPASRTKRTVAPPPGKRPCVLVCTEPRIGGSDSYVGNEVKLVDHIPRVAVDDHNQRLSIISPGYAYVT